MTQVTFTTPESGPNAPEPAAPNTPAERPEWLPENFATPEDMAKSYQEAQAALTQSRQELARLKGETPPAPDSENPPNPDPNDPPNDPPNQDGDEKPDDDPATDPSDAAKKVADAAGVDLDPYQSEYDSTGDVSDESRDAIAESLKGVLGEKSREIVDQFIESQKVVHENDRNLFREEAGGSQEHLDTLLAWGTENLPDEEYAVFSRQFESRDRHSILFAIRGLRAQYEAANGRIPNNVTASAGAVPSNTAPFNSAAEMTTAMRDPRYKTDPAYREKVAARLAASKF